MGRLLCAIVLVAACSERNPKFDEDGGAGTDTGATGGTGDGGADDGAGSDGDDGSGGTGGGTGDDGGTGTSGGVGSGSTGDGGSTVTDDPTTGGGGTSAGTSSDPMTTGPVTTTDPMTTGPMTSSDPMTTGPVTTTDPMTTGPMTTTGGGTTTGGLGRLCDAGDASLVGCYEFEDVESDTLTDDSSYGNHGVGSGVTTDAGVSGKAGVFSDLVKLAIPDDPSLNPTTEVTIDLWIAPELFPTMEPDGIVDKDGQWWIKITSIQKVSCGIEGIGSLTGGSLSAGTWTHIACVYDGDKVRMYQDGQPRGMVGSPRPLRTGSTEIIVGNEGPDLGHPFRGRMDRLRIWNRGLTPEEICKAAGRTSC